MYLPIIRYKLQQFVLSWNNHTIRKAGRPVKLFAPVLQNPTFVPDDRLEDMIEHFGIESEGMIEEEELEQTVHVPDEVDVLTVDEANMRLQMYEQISHTITTYEDKYIWFKNCTKYLVQIRNN